MKIIIILLLLSASLDAQYSTVTIKEKITVKDSELKALAVKVPDSMRGLGQWDSLGVAPRDYDVLMAEIDANLATFPAGYLAQSYSVLDTGATDTNYNSGLTSDSKTLKYFRIAADTTLPIAFFVGSMHGWHEWQHGYCWRDLIEIMSDNITTAFMEDFFSRYQMLVIPTLNTYGVFTLTNNNSYANYNWVNLMENFDEGWSLASEPVGDRFYNPGEGEYRGQKAFSEPETRMVKLLAELFDGLHTLALYNEYHTSWYSVVYDRPIDGYVYWTTDWEAKLQLCGTAVTKYVGLLYPNSGSYPPAGYTEGIRGAPTTPWPLEAAYWNTLTNITSVKWFNANFGCPAFITEISSYATASPESVYKNYNEFYQELFFESIYQTIYYFLLN